MTSDPQAAREDAETTFEDLDSSSQGAKFIAGGDVPPRTRLPVRYLAYWRPILVTALVVAAVGLAVGLYFLQYRPDRQIDDAAAQRAIRAASDGVVASLSYSPANMARDFAAAKSHLTGDFLAHYDKFTKEIVTPLVQQKHIAQTAAVVRAAVSELHPDSAVVLVFLNETTTGKDKPEPLVTPSSVRITLTKVNGSWLIAKLDPFG